MLRTVLIVMGVGLLLASTPAISQPKDDPAKAMAKYEEAERYYKLAEFETALTLYRESYLLSGEPELLFNIGQCNRQMKFYEEAIKNYKAYLRDVPFSSSKTEVESLINELEEKLKAESQPASTSTSVPIAEKPVFVPLTMSRLWRQSKVAKLGVGVVGSSLLLGGTSIAMAVSNRSNEDTSDLLLFTKKQQTAQKLALVSDLVAVAGVACIGYGWWYNSAKHQASIAIQVEPHSTVAVLSLEF